jgi:hypothetical protein
MQLTDVRQRVGLRVFFNAAPTRDLRSAIQMMTLLFRPAID